LIWVLSPSELQLEQSCCRVLGHYDNAEDINKLTSKLISH